MRETAKTEGGDGVSFPLVPQRVADSIYDLDPAALRESGVRLLLCDLDNTLISYEETMPSPRLLAWRDAMEERGIRVFVVSNSRKSRRCPDFCAAFGVPFVRHAGKPGTGGIRRALSEAGVSPGEALLVGDQIFTDVWGAGNAGVGSVLVKPIAIGRNPLRAVRYAIETPFRWAGKRK